MGLWAGRFPLWVPVSSWTKPGSWIRWSLTGLGDFRFPGYAAPCPPQGQWISLFVSVFCICVLGDFGPHSALAGVEAGAEELDETPAQAWAAGQRRRGCLGQGRCSGGSHLEATNGLWKRGGKEELWGVTKGKAQRKDPHLQSHHPQGRRGGFRTSLSFHESQG